MESPQLIEAPPLPAVKPHVVILTSGISGSSVLTGLIGRSGHWVGDATFKKEYDTYENSELIGLNLQILSQAGYTGDYAKEFSGVAIERIASLSGRIDEAPYLDFLKKCDAHQPWVWKDPRLWLTIRFWRHLLNLEDCRFILLTRSYPHSWVSSILRRHIRSYASLKRYEQSIRNSLTDFLKANDLPYLHLTFEDLVVQPEETIRKLNAHVGTNLTVEDLTAIYHKPLYKAPRSSLVDYAKAILIYLKNYGERIDLWESQ